jgi:hypothetical protein
MKFDYLVSGSYQVTKNKGRSWAGGKQMDVRACASGIWWCYFQMNPVTDKVTNLVKCIINPLLPMHLTGLIYFSEAHW